MTYSGMWIGREGHIAWPPWSPELNAIDFFFRVRITEGRNVYVLRLHSTFARETSWQDFRQFVHSISCVIWR